MIELAEKFAENAGMADLGRIASMDVDDASQSSLIEMQLSSTELSPSVDGDALIDQFQQPGENKLLIGGMSRAQLISAAQSALHQSKMLQETMREDISREVEVSSAKGVLLPVLKVITTGTMSFA